MSRYLSEIFVKNSKFLQIRKIRQKFFVYSLGTLLPGRAVDMFVSFEKPSKGVCSIYLQS